MENKKEIRSLAGIFVLALLALVEAIMLQTKSVKENPVVITEGLMEYPPDLIIRDGRISLKEEPYWVDWAYAVSDTEWHSIKDELIYAIDLKYPEYLQTSSEGTKVLKLSFSEKPDSILHIRRYSESLLLSVEDVNSGEETEETFDISKLREKLERKLDYEEYEEVEFTTNEDGTVDFDVPANEGYIYEVWAVWDRSDFRGTAIYSFLIK